MQSSKFVGNVTCPARLFCGVKDAWEELERQEAWEKAVAKRPKKKKGPMTTYTGASEMLKLPAWIFGNKFKSKGQGQG